MGLLDYYVNTMNEIACVCVVVVVLIYICKTCADNILLFLLLSMQFNDSFLCYLCNLLFIFCICKDNLVMGILEMLRMRLRKGLKVHLMWWYHNLVLDWLRRMRFHFHPSRHAIVQPRVQVIFTIFG